MIICTDLISFVVSVVIYFSRLRVWQMNQLGITGFFFGSILNNDVPGL